MLRNPGEIASLAKSVRRGCEFRAGALQYYSTTVLQYCRMYATLGHRIIVGKRS